MSKFNTKEMKDSLSSKGNKKERKEDAVDVFMGMYKDRTGLVLNDIKMNQPFGQGRGPGILEDIGIDYKTAGAGAASLKGLCLDKITSDDKVGIIIPPIWDLVSGLLFAVLYIHLLTTR